MKRRSLVLGGLGAVAGLTWLARPRDRGENHAPYYAGLSDALDRAALSGPTLVIDKQRMLANVATLGGHIGTRFDYRIVVKSLPSLPLRLLLLLLLLLLTRMRRTAASSANAPLRAGGHCMYTRNT